MNMENDEKQFEERGLDEKMIELQVDTFKKGIPFLNVSGAATVGNGVLKLDNVEQQGRLWENAIQEGISVVKFVPASGAASRMFKDLFYFMNKPEPYPERESVKVFFQKIEDFAFFDDLSDYMDDLEIADNNYFKKLVSRILDKSGLGYGVLPKGLIKFHKYETRSRTAFEEHLVEGAMYACQNDKSVNIHFTVSEEHLMAFNKLQKKVLAEYQKELGVEFNVSYSVQKPSTDTIAVNTDNSVFRNEDGSMLFRPGGHGALIENLNELEADIIFIKNIDNVVPDHFKGYTVAYKKALAGTLVDLRNSTFKYLNALNDANEDLVSEVVEFIDKHLCFKFNTGFDTLDLRTKIDLIRNRLDRPIRVCGMVKNTGEPGGGPFWVQDKDGNSALQIAEMSQLDIKDPNVESMVQKATHFNPVDLVCSVKRHDGSKYDLLEFRDPDTGFISHKSKDGKELKALELPGLWNGAMAYWNTIFVEVPVETFNPVKEVNDLLRKEHQPV